MIFGGSKFEKPLFSPKIKENHKFSIIFIFNNYFEVYYLKKYLFYDIIHDLYHCMLDKTNFRVKIKIFEIFTL